MTNLPELLARLSEWPEVCQAQVYPNNLPTLFQMSGYEFWFTEDELLAQHFETNSICSGQPAYACLLDSLMRACEGKGWDIETLTINDEKYDDGLQSRATVNHHYVWSKTITEALLEALIAALGNK